jgi:hypothetical protein
MKLKNGYWEIGRYIEWIVEFIWNFYMRGILNGF